MPHLLEELQASLGSAYTIEHELGGAGMSRVFVAYETALHRKVVLKVLPPSLFGALSVERFERETRLAARMQHPYIVPILAAGKTDRSFYYTMPFVPGESIRQRLAREHQLPIDEAVRLVCDVAEALAHAHAEGVVHRDVKPDNILSSGGHALLTDFGIARAIESAGADTLTATGISVGTPHYMAPEQATGAGDADARADIYALGCVAYELLAGEPPFTGPTAQAIVAKHFAAPFPEVRHTRPSVSPAIDAVLRKATAKIPADRFTTVQEFARALTSAANPSDDGIAAVAGATSGSANVQSRETSRGVSRRWRSAVAALLVLVLAGAAAIYGARRPALTEKDTILLADFVNTTGDSVFDGTLKQALSVQLQQTPFMNLYPEEGVAETLKLMQRAPGERVTRQIGREICQRHALKAMVVGTVANIGRTYMITLEAISAQSGETIASEQTQATDKDSVLSALQQASTALRGKLGESLGSIEKYNAPIEQATTSSLEALSLYSKGLEQIYSGNTRGALPLFNRAVELDTNFASAYNWISWSYANFGNNHDAARFAQKAFALRDRVTERERMHIDGAYYIWGASEWEKAYDVEQQASRLYPSDWMPYNNLAIGYHAAGEEEKAVEQARKGIAVNPNEVHLYWHLSNALIRLNRFDEARTVIQRGQAQRLDHPWYRMNLYLIAFAQGDTLKQRASLAAIRERDDERTALGWEARAAAFEGRWRDAQLLFRRSALLAAAAPTAAAPNVEPLLRASLLGSCPPAQDTALLSSVRLNASPRQIVIVPIDRDGAVCGDASAAERLADEQARRFPHSSHIAVYSVPFLRAAVALRRGEPQRAIDALQRTMPHDAAAFFWPNYLRGEAYLQLKDGTQAAAEFQKIIDHRGWDPLSQLYPVAYLGLARAETLAGHAERSRSAYQALFALWNNGDADLPALVQAKREFALLRKLPSGKSRR